MLKEEQQRTGIKLLWATAYLFINPRFAHGAATSPNADVFVYAAAQVKKAIDVAHELGAEGYVFWGGREGYSSLWNTDMKRRSNTLRNSCTWPSITKSRSASRGPSTSSPNPRNQPSINNKFAAVISYGLTTEVLPTGGDINVAGIHRNLQQTAERMEAELEKKRGNSSMGVNEIGMRCRSRARRSPWDWMVALSQSRSDGCSN